MEDSRSTTAITVVVLAYGAEPWLERSVKSILASTGVSADVVVVDNGCTDGGVDLVGSLPGVTIVRPGRNTGFAEGCNVGVAAASASLIALVNPDAIVEPGALRALADVALESDVGIATASIRLADRPDRLNSAGNALHCSGVSWSGWFDELAADHPDDRDVIAASGAGMAMRRDVWDALGGFDPMFFAYYEDADLSVRCWQHGWRVVYVADAVIVHRYEFSRRPEKYFLLERNRLLLVQSCYEARTLALLLPLLVVIELGFLGLAIREHWARQKLQSWKWHLVHRREVRDRRRDVQRARRVADRELAHLFSPDLLPGNYSFPSWWPKINRVIRAYWRMVSRHL